MPTRKAPNEIKDDFREAPHPADVGIGLGAGAGAGVRAGAVAGAGARVSPVLHLQMVKLSMHELVSHRVTSDRQHFGPSDVCAEVQTSSPAWCRGRAGAAVAQVEAAEVKTRQ